MGKLLVFPGRGFFLELVDSVGYRVESRVLLFGGSGEGALVPVFVDVPLVGGDGGVLEEGSLERGFCYGD